MRVTRLLALCFAFGCSQFASLHGQENDAATAPDRASTITELGSLYGELLGTNDLLLYEMKIAADQKDTESVNAVFARKDSEYESRFSRLMELAAAAPETAVARDAAILTLKTTYAHERDTAIDLLLDHHIKSHRIDEALTCLAYTGRSTNICRRVLEANDDASVRAHAEFQIAYKTWRSSDEAREQAKAQLWDLVKTGEKITFHSSVWGPNQTTKNVSTVASYLLKRITGSESVKIGEPIPSFGGSDFDGRKVAVEDYRGKVTLIVFWATWCGPCLKLTELETHLLDRYDGLPFEILGVCGDDEITEQVKEVAEKHGIVWTSIHDVQEGGPRLSERFGAPAWPYCILLDREGVVRQTEFPASVTNDPAGQKEAFQSAIEQLLPEYQGE